MIIYIESLREVMTKILELRSDYRQVVAYKVNVAYKVTFLYTSNEQMEFEIKNTISFTLGGKK